MSQLIENRIVSLLTAAEQHESRLKAHKIEPFEPARGGRAFRDMVVGGAVLAAMKEDGELANRVRAALSRLVTREEDRQTIADLLNYKPATPRQFTRADDPMFGY